MSEGSQEMSAPEERIETQLIFLYGEETGRTTYQETRSRLLAFLQEHPHLKEKKSPTGHDLSERDSILITYGDQFRKPGQTPLQSLFDFLSQYLLDHLSGIHILPFFPYSSDDGFSVIDYTQVDPDLGSWDDITRLSQEFRLMVDAVVNHISRHSVWFQKFIRGQAPYDDYFITMDPHEDLSMVVRPRALPLLTPVETARGEVFVWTTFSDDQIDLNFANPRVLLEILDTLLYYISCGAEIIRLDAIAYLWKEIGTPSIHLPQTHAVVKFFRAALEWVAPDTILITETNVPHEDNISYFGQPLPGGSGTDEAQMVYQFPLAPLVLHSFLSQNAEKLSAWASGLRTPSPGTYFFNFIASHDGIGVMPARGLITSEEIQALVDQTRNHGGQLGLKTNPDGSQSVYELNITLFDALNDPRNPDPELDIRRFLASQAIMLSLAGVPGIYIHSLFGSSNCQPCFDQTGRGRSLNREKFDLTAMQSRLADPDSRASQVLAGYKRLLEARQVQPAFHPAGEQTLLDLNPAVFSLVRAAPDLSQPILALVNVSAQSQSLNIDLDAAGLPVHKKWVDVISSSPYHAHHGTLVLELNPYQYAWLRGDQV